MRTGVLRIDLSSIRQFGDLLQGLHVTAMKLGVSIRYGVDSVNEMFAQRRQAVKWDSWKDVMFAVIGHVPGNKLDHRIGQCGAGVFEHILSQFTGCMLS